MSVTDFIISNWPLILLLTAMVVMTKTAVHLTGSMSRELLVIIGLAFALSVIDYIETYLGYSESYSFWRSVLTAAKYVVPPFILALMIRVLLGYRRLYLFIPAAICFVLCTVSIFTKLVFYFDTELNEFYRGPLGYLPFIVDIIYLGFFVFKALKNSNHGLSDIFPILFLAVSGVLVTILPVFWGQQFARWFTITVAISLFVYYVFMIQQLTKKDALTGLLNRQSYYSDIERNKNDITALVSLDMNGLKATNDEKGHAAGDEALRTLADCFTGSTRFGQLVYRIGGDEFMIICLRGGRAETEKLVKKIRSAVHRADVSCSIGFCCKDECSDTDEMFRIADERMYEDKKKYYYKEIGKKVFIGFE